MKASKSHSFEPPRPLVDQVARLPTSAGCYLMKNARGTVLYVGKATNLRARVRSYLRGTDGRMHVRFLMSQVASIDFSLAADARDALILEDILIKKYKPRYNIRLRDDKTYLSVRIDTTHAFPRIELMRRPRRDGARYFGPYSSAAAIRKTVDFIHRLFPLRTCEDWDFKTRKRPCLQYQIKRCLAPCVGLCSQETYAGLLDQVIMLLEGRNVELKGTLERAMRQASDRLAFEEAAELRDRMRAVESVASRGQVVHDGRVDRDIIGFHREADDVSLTVLPIRQGRMHDHQTYVFHEQIGTDEEILLTFLTQFYSEGGYVPREIHLPSFVGSLSGLSAVLKERAPHAIRIAVPKRGEKSRLIDLAAKTARAVLAQSLDQQTRARRAGLALQQLLGLPSPPRRLECFDISNTQGKQPVASGVHFEDGVPNKDRYRRYRIKTLDERPDDYGMMREVLIRRIRRGLEEGMLPDLLVVDGGKGQLNVATAVLKDLGVEGQAIIAFAKPDKKDSKRKTRIVVDKIFVPGRKNPIVLPAHSPALHLLQALRDESHRFAITYHRSLRRKHTLHSMLDEIPGVGPAKRKLLLKTFGSVKQIRQADEETLAALPGIGPALARRILDHLRGEEAADDEGLGNTPEAPSCSASARGRTSAR